MATLKLVPLIETTRPQRRRFDKHERSVMREALKFTRAMKKGMSEMQWGNLQQFILPVAGLKEASAVSDDVIAKTIAKISKEMTKGKVEIDPTKIDVDDLEKGKGSAADVLEPGAIQKESKSALNEMGPVMTTILAAPTLVKFLGNIVDWAGSQVVGDEKSRGVNRIIGRIYSTAKKRNEIPSKKEIESKLGVFTKGTAGGALTFKDDAKYIDAAFQRIAGFVKKDNVAGKAKAEKGPGSIGRFFGKKKDPSSFHALGFDPEGNQPQKADKHLQHILYNASFDTKLGKFIGNLGHKLHDLFILPIRLVISGVMVVMKALGNFGKMMGGSADDLQGINLRSIWKKSKSISNVIYAFIMLFVAIKGGVTAYEHISEHVSGMKSALANVGANAKDLYVLAADTAKGGDMTAASIEAAIEIAGSAGEIT